EPAYALSFISYARCSRRDGFLRFASALAQTMAAIFDARPHWGKICPLSPDELARLYPQLAEFARIQKQIYPSDVVTNDWTRSVLAFATDPRQSPISNSPSDIIRASPESAPAPPAR